MNNLQSKLDKEVAEKESPAEKPLPKDFKPSKIGGEVVTPSEPTGALEGPVVSAGTPVGLDQQATFQSPGKHGLEDVEKYLVDDSGGINKQMTADAKRTKLELWGTPENPKPLVTFMCPLDIGEKPGVAKEFVSINGYNLEIMKGVMVQIPVAIAERLMEYYKINAGHVAMDKRLDRSPDVQSALGR